VDTVNAMDDRSPIPDLLSHVPTLRLDAHELKQTLTFAFASGVPQSAFQQAIQNGSVVPSTWDPDQFARDLFVSELVSGCLGVTIDGHKYRTDQGHIARVLSHPPTDPATVELRREVLRDLSASPAMRKELEQIYTGLHRWKSLLESQPIGRRGFDANRRRLDILAAAKTAIDTMAGAFETAKSALVRLSAFGVEVRKTEAYARLTDLLDYDDHLASLDVKLRLGSDGRVRGFEILAAKENEGNWFYASPLGRIMTRLLMLARGYRFTDQEVLARIIDGVYDGLEDRFVLLFQLTSDLEPYLCALAFRDWAEKNGHAVCLPDLVDPGKDGGPCGASRELRGLFNPLLLASTSPVVACDVVTDRHDGIVVVTGPNSGGKTRLLQAVAIAQMMGQAGFFVPARQATLRRTPGLFVSFIEGAQADQTEGRLGTELVRIRSLFEKLDMGSMVILDELCSGTNPSEGEEIFELVVSLLSELEPQAFITTHFLALATRLAKNGANATMTFLQVELDAQKWPTYRFVPGVAQTSLAHRTAARLGVTREELLGLIERRKRARPLSA
jgi:DNA mismatch repair protein MutS2